MYDRFNLMKEANLTVNRGKRIGIVGRNGTGKSNFHERRRRDLSNPNCAALRPSGPNGPSSTQ